MCGITGYLGFKGNGSEQKDILKRMTSAMVHRGPDDSGTWIDENVGVAFGHCRLAILDLSPQGHQPMLSTDGRYVIVFNGEVYNYQQIREELEEMSPSPKWRGHSDTEVILAAISRWGVEEAVKRFIGMFAIALWDRKDRILYLLRDRLGEKPLYYGRIDNVFLFASELRAMRIHPVWHGEIDRNAITLLLRHNYIPAPYSIYKNVHKLLPGTILTMPYRGNQANVDYTIKEYWSAKEAAEKGIAKPFQGALDEASQHLEVLLRDSIRQQMVADVPIGAFLSGGIDSSTVVALMQVQSSRPVKTFTIGFCEKSYDEAKYAREVAKHLGTDHTELYVTPEDAMQLIPRLPDVYDEPFSDPSQVPTFLVCQLARKYVTVSLSGDGGDELFCGYNRYFWGHKLWSWTGWIPRSVRSAMAKAIISLSPSSIGALPQRLVEILSSDKPEAMYRELVSHWVDPSSLVLDSKEPHTVLNDRSRWANVPDFISQMMYMDIVSYLPDDILTKVDRAAMSVSLESRVPLLDHRVVEFAWRIPLSMKIHNGRGKWILRQVLYKYVPKELIERSKMGFGIPIGIWLRGPLREWSEELLSEKRLNKDGFFNISPIRKKWKEHLSGKYDWHYWLWDVLMFQAWKERWHG